mmetsp:Transcript_30665/g.49159  ORF Transcript_30665/g.49159 Transcript_30665/m.49159 type:complete len:150 (-) Transcript_30665:132-581(-)
MPGSSRDPVRRVRFVEIPVISFPLVNSFVRIFGFAMSSLTHTSGLLLPQERGGDEIRVISGKFFWIEVSSIMMTLGGQDEREDWRYNGCLYVSAKVLTVYNAKKANMTSVANMSSGFDKKQLIPKCWLMVGVTLGVTHPANYSKKAVRF